MRRRILLWSAADHILEDGRHLFVATGPGTSILPVRFRVPPAVTLLTLTADRQPDGSRGR